MHLLRWKLAQQGLMAYQLSCCHAELAVTQAGQQQWLVQLHLGFLLNPESWQLGKDQQWVVRKSEKKILLERHVQGAPVQKALAQMLDSLQCDSIV